MLYETIFKLDGFDLGSSLKKSSGLVLFGAGCGRMSFAEECFCLCLDGRMGELRGVGILRSSNLGTSTGSTAGLSGAGLSGRAIPGFFGAIVSTGVLEIGADLSAVAVSVISVECITVGAAAGVVDLDLGLSSLCCETFLLFEGIFLMVCI